MDTETFRALCVSLLTMGNYIAGQLDELSLFDSKGLALFQGTIASVQDSHDLAPHYGPMVSNELVKDALDTWNVWLYTCMSLDLPYPEHGSDASIAGRHIDEVILSISE